MSDELPEPPESFSELAGKYPFGLVAGGLLLGMAADVGRTYGQSAAQSAGKGARQGGELGKRLLDEAIKAVSKRI